MSWKTLKINSLGKVVTGKTPSSKRPELFGVRYPFITPSEMNYGERLAQPVRYLSEEGAKSQKNLLLPARSVAFACIASIGKCCLINQPTFTNQQVNSIVVNALEHDAEFIYYMLVNERERIRSYASGAATPIINKTSFGEIDIRAPDLPLQRRIASILSAYDDLIENNTRRIEILKEMTRRLYEEWFVQFRFPGHEGVKFKESELGRIPEGWKHVFLESFGMIITGKTPSKKRPELFGREVPFIKLPDMHDQIFITETIEGLSREGEQSQRKKTVPANSICVSCIGTGGVVAITSEPSQTNQQINTVIPARSDLREFLYFSALSLRDVINNHGATGATMTNLSRGKFASLQVTSPSQEVVSSYSTLVAPIFDRIQNLQRANRNLRAQRDLLLPKLVSGEIDVSNIRLPDDKEVEAA